MMKHLIKATYFFSPFVLLVMIFMNQPTKYTNLTYLLPMIFGVFSYTWLLWQFVLSARPKLIERYFGLDQLYRFHGTVALVSVGMVFIHKSLIEMIFSESTMTQLGSFAFFLFISVSALSLLFMSTKLLKRLPILHKIVEPLKAIKTFSYERIKLLHNLTLIGLILMQIHVLLTSSSRQSPLIFTTYMLYFFIAVGFYLYHKVLKPWLLEDRKYWVSSIIQETPDTWTIILTPEKGESLHYAPGQFGFFRISSEGVQGEEHPFTISSSPIDRTHLSITVKALGDYTKKIHLLKIGDTVTVDGPYGKFTYMDDHRESSTVLIAGGVGITPFLSMLQHMKHADSQRRVLLIWAVRKKEDLIQYHIFQDIQNQMPNFTFIPIVSNDETWSGEKGMLDPSRIKMLTENFHSQNQQTGYFICGPLGFMQMTIESLQKLGISKKQIHYEQFTV